jgi:hypothetical protein
MQSLNRILIGFIAFCATLGAALGTLLYVSLIPRFGQIGTIAFVVLCIFLGYGVILGGAFTWFKIQSMRHYSRFVRHGEVVSYIGPNKPTVVSAEHEQAKIPRLLPAPEPKEDEPAYAPDEQDFLNIYNQSTISLKELAPKLNMTYYQAQKLYSDAKSRGLITRK